jgi:hypothetical protein
MKYAKLVLPDSVNDGALVEVLWTADEKPVYYINHEMDWDDFHPDAVMVQMQGKPAGSVLKHELQYITFQ